VLGRYFLIGEVVRVPVADMDKAKVNNSNLTGVIVEINAVRMKARVVVKAGLLKPWYDTINSAMSEHLEITSSCLD